MAQDYVNMQAAQLAAQIANNAAQVAYMNARLDFEKEQFYNLSAYQKEQLAIERAKQAWTEKYQQAQIDIARGELDLAKLTQQQKNELDQARLRFDQAKAAGYLEDGTKTLEREQVENQAALGLLGVAKDLRGPRDMFRYMDVLGNAPQGLTSMLDAVAGRYNLSTGAGQATEAASLGGLVDDIRNGGLPPSVRPGGQYAQFAPPQAGQTAALQARAYGVAPVEQGRILETMPYQGGLQREPGAQAAVMPGGVPLREPAIMPGGAPGQQINAPAPTNKTNSPLQDDLAKPMGSTTPQPAPGLLDPGQWSADAVNKMLPAQREAMLGLYESRYGWRPEEVEAKYKMSLPKYGGPARGTVKTF